MSSHAGSALRIGILGYGGIAAEHARALAELGCSLRVVMGPDVESARAFARKFGFARASGSLGDVVGAADIDAVVVASPTEVHADQALRVVGAGKHLLCEIPLATSLKDAEQIADAVDRASVTAMVCHTQRFFAPVAEILRRVLAGELTVTHVVHCTCIQRRENIGWTGQPRSWIDDILWHHGAHAVDLANELLGGHVAAVSAELGEAHAETGRPLDASIILRSESRALASLVLSYNAAQPPINELIVVARQGTYRIENGALVGDPARDVASAISGAVLAQDELFVRAVAGERAPRPTPRELLPAYALLQRISRDGSTV